MNLRKICTLCLAICCALSTALTAWAGPGDGLPSTEYGNTSTSPVILCGGGETTAETAKAENTKANTAAETGKKGASLGMFTTTGYCNCSKCSGGFGLTYSGTVPKANHTISADLSLYPIGTKLMIHDIIYTVEDMGSGVNGHWIDIYYDNHEAAVAHGMKQEEVFMVE